MTTYAYIRVSTVDQDTEKNKLDILCFANENKLGNVDFIEEHITGKKHFKFRKLGQLLDKMRKGEVLNISKQKGITLYALKEHFSTDDEGITATVISTVFALIAQIERELISLRTKEALYARKIMGIKLGRPKGKGKSRLDQYKDEIIRLVELKVPKTIIAKQYNTSVINLYNYLNSCDIKTKGANKCI